MRSLLVYGLRLFAASLSTAAGGAYANATGAIFAAIGVLAWLEALVISEAY